MSETDVNKTNADLHAQPAGPGAAYAGDATANPANPDNPDNADNNVKPLLQLRELGKRSRARALRLKNDDILVAIDGQMFFGNADELHTRLTLTQQPGDVVDEEFEEDDEEEAEKFATVTLYRDGELFDLLVPGPLGGTWTFAAPELTQTCRVELNGHLVEAAENYSNYEVLRDINNLCVIYSTKPEVLPRIVPFIWLVQNRLWEPLLATIVIYTMGLGVHWVVFAIVYILTCVYFGRGQTSVLRSYAMFQDRQMWMVLAARSIKEAQETARRLEPKCKFKFSYIPPPKRSALQPAE